MQQARLLRYEKWLSSWFCQLGSRRTMGTLSSARHVDTTERGLTKEFTCPVPWGHLAGKTWGDEKNPPVICMHGWLDNCNTFDRLIPLLPQDYYYVAFDTPGHGLSSHFPPGMFYFTMAYCAAVKRLIDHFKFGKITFLGHSMGANIAAHFSGLYPEIAKRLIILDTWGVWYNWKGDFATSLRSSIDSALLYEKEEKPAKEYSYEEAFERLKEANQDLDDESVKILLGRGMKEIEKGKFVFTRDKRHLFKDPMERTLDSALAVSENRDAHVLMIVAKQGLWWSKARFGLPDDYKRITESYEKKSRSFKQAVVDGHHHVHLTDPEKAAEVITEFLLEHPMEEAPESKI